MENIVNFRDLDLNFIKHPINNDVSQLLDANAVKRALKNLILLEKGDKPFHPEINAGISEAFFENMGAIQSDQLKSKINSIIEKYEPRVLLTNLIVKPNLDGNDITVDFYFVIKNLQTPVSFSLVLSRNR